MGFTKEQLRLYANLFVSRRDDYAMQQEDGRYRRAGRPLTYTTLQRHLLGAETIGTYVIDERGMCRFAVFDDDRESPDLDVRVARLVAVQAALHAVGILSYLEGSRRGAHLWVFSDRLVPALQLRTWLLSYCPEGVEFYPKQDAATGGYGSLMRLPLGVHRRTQMRYWFFSWHAEQQLRLAPTARTVQESLAWLSRIRRASVPTSLDLPATPATRHPTSPVNDTPSLAKNQAGTAPSPSTTQVTSIRSWAASLDPVAVIGRYVEMDAHGMGCCPFGWHHANGKDTHPSLRVYRPKTPGLSCWYCYAWGQGGTLFDFLCYWHDVDAKTLWKSILGGEVF